MVLAIYFVSHYKVCFFNCLLDYVLFTCALILAAENLSNPIQDGVDQLPETRGIHSDTMKISTFISQDDVGSSVVEDLPLEGSINLTLSADD